MIGHIPHGVAAIDRSVIDEYRAMADDKFVAEVIEQFLIESPPAIATIQTASANRQSAPLRAAAHSLKGSSATVGAHTLSAICGEIERLARANALDQASCLFAALTIEYQRARAELQTLSGSANDALD